MPLLQLADDEARPLDLWLSVNHFGRRRDALARPSEWAALLSRVPLFASLVPAQLTQIASLLRLVRLGPHALLPPLSAAPSLWLVDAGACADDEDEAPRTSSPSSPGRRVGGAIRFEVGA